MAAELGILVAVGAALLAFNSWTATFALCTVVAILQDPLRKIAPDQPVYFVILTGVVLAAGYLGAFSARVPLAPSSIHGWRRYVGAPFGAFVAIVILQSIHSFGTFGSATMTGIGILSYLAAVPAIVLAYQFALKTGFQGISTWMWTYVTLASCGLIGVYLEYTGVRWPVLGQVGGRFLIYDVGMAMTAYAGFFRAAEVAAWHTVTVSACLVVLLYGKRKSLPGLVFSLAAATALIGVGMLTGRRKLLVQLTVFACAYLGLFAVFQKRSRKIAGVVGVMGLSLYLFLMGFTGQDAGEKQFDSHSLSVASDDIYQAYLLRARSVVEDVGARVNGFGLETGISAYQMWGFFGAGVGVGSQGTQHFDTASGIDKAAAEGGVGKLVTELGVPGFLVVIWLVAAMTRYVIDILSFVVVRSPEHARLGFGLTAFLVSNIASFAVATQVYGDLFVLMCLGWSTGFLLALPLLPARGVRVESSRASPVQPNNQIRFAQAPVRSWN